MKRLFPWLALAGILLVGSTATAATTAVDQKRAFGTIAKGTTACVGPLSPSTSEGVQLFGFTNGQPNLTWQVFSVSAQTAPALVFQSTGTGVSQVVPPSGNMLFHACVVKTTNTSQDFDITLNSQPLG